MNLVVTNEWPETLPLPLLEASGAPRYATLVGAPESPFIQRRNRFKKNYVGMRVGWRLEPSQWQEFRTFVDGTLGNGVAKFTIQLRYPSALSLTTWMVRFIGDYSGRWSDGLYDVSAALDLIEPFEIAAPAGGTGGGEGFGAESFSVLGGDPFLVLGGETLYVIEE